MTSIHLRRQPRPITTPPWAGLIERAAARWRGGAAGSSSPPLGAEAPRQPAVGREARVGRTPPGRRQRRRRAARSADARANLRAHAQPHAKAIAPRRSTWRMALVAVALVTAAVLVAWLVEWFLVSTPTGHEVLAYLHSTARALLSSLR